MPWTNEGMADARNSMVPRALDYTGGTTTTPDRQQQAPMNPFWSPAGQDGVKPLANGGSSLSVPADGQAGEAMELVVRVKHSVCRGPQDLRWEKGEHCLRQWMKLRRCGCASSRRLR